MKILITGCSGQLAKELIIQSPSNVELIPSDRNLINLKNLNECKEVIENLKPDWLINCAAYTNVEKAENEYEDALKINALAPKEFAYQIKKHGGKMLQISTDFVFNGEQNFPYKTEQIPNPLNKYGFSKLKGEEYIRDILFETNQGIILRTSWLMGKTGSNFALTIIKLLEAKSSLKIVSDQYSSPTSTKTLSQACWKLISTYNDSTEEKRKSQKIFHWSDEGVASWYDVAVEINKILTEKGILRNKRKILPIKTLDYQTAAVRPKYSALNCFSTVKFINLKQIKWEKSLRETIDSITSNKF